MRDDFCALILTHGRPDNIQTLAALKRFGYTGAVYLVVDDEDAALPAYRAKFGDMVVAFSKAEIEPSIDLCDNRPERNTVLYARNASFEIARRLGHRYFVQCAYLAATPFLSVAISQGGDHIGGGASPQMKAIQSRRKAMNSFVCDVERPFAFRARMNDDVTTYTELQRSGRGAFLTFLAPQLVQTVTQVNAGGLSAMYAEHGTYVKSFYSVMVTPSAVRIGMIRSHGKGEARPRIHHFIDWNACAPRILRQEHRKP